MFLLGKWWRHTHDNCQELMISEDLSIWTNCITASLQRLNKFDHVDLWSTIIPEWPILVVISDLNLEKSNRIYCIILYIYIYYVCVCDMEMQMILSTWGHIGFGGSRMSLSSWSPKINLGWSGNVSRTGRHRSIESCCCWFTVVGATRQQIGPPKSREDSKEWIQLNTWISIPSAASSSQGQIAPLHVVLMLVVLGIYRQDEGTDPCFMPWSWARLNST